MNVETCSWVRTSLGVYVLGAIEPAERAEVDAHLPACSRCRDEVAALAGLPALLGRVNEEQIAEVASPPEELLESLLAVTVAERPRIRRRRVSLAVAAVLVLFVGALLGGGLTRESPQVALPRLSTTSAEQLTATDAATHVTAWVSMSSEDWGTGVAVRLGGAPPGARCRLFAIAKDGHRDVAASWQVEYGAYADFDGSTMIFRSDLAGFEIMTIEGRKLLSIPI